MSKRYLPPGVKSSSQAYEELIDHAMHQVKGAAWKALMYLARRTVGFGKVRDKVGLDQLCHGIRKSDGSRLDWGTGLSKRAVIRGLAELEAAQLVHRTGGHGAVKDYAINWSAVSSSENGTGAKKSPPHAKKAPALVPKSHPQSAVQPAVLQPADIDYPATNSEKQNSSPGCLSSFLTEQMGEEPTADTARMLLKAANGASVEEILEYLRGVVTTKNGRYGANGTHRARTWGWWVTVVRNRFAPQRKGAEWQLPQDQFDEMAAPLEIPQ